MLSSVFSGASKKGAKQSLSDIEVNRVLSVKTLFPPDFGLVKLDLLETLGTGTFGRVRLVRSLEDHQYYALKMMKKGRIVRLRQLEHIQNEVRILSRVRCSFVSELYAVFQDDNSLYVMLEYIPGGELFSHLRRQEKFSQAECQFYTVELVCALQYLHELNVVYRDVKPENIMIHKDGHLRLVDFGFAKFLDDDRTFTLCGTPEYLAPETIQGVGHGMAVDWWAAGVLLFEMAAGYPPFYGDNPFSVYQKILEANIKFPSAMHRLTRSAVSSFCVTNRARRLGSGRNGFAGIKAHRFFLGIDWISASRQLIMPPVIPSVLSDGDTSNFDFYAEEAVEEANNLTATERGMFREFDSILERPSS